MTVGPHSVPSGVVVGMVAAAVTLSNVPGDKRADETSPRFGCPGTRPALSGGTFESESLHPPPDLGPILSELSRDRGDVAAIPLECGRKHDSQVVVARRRRDSRKCGLADRGSLELDRTTHTRGKVSSIRSRAIASAAASARSSSRIFKGHV